jgi:hypothetical protein
MAGMKKTVVKPAKTTVKKLDKSKLYDPNKAYNTPMTLDQQRRYNKLSQNPKTSQTMFTLPKGTEKLSPEQKKQIQAKRLLDRQRTLSRAANIIRRDVNPIMKKMKKK